MTCMLVLIPKENGVISDRYDVVGHVPLEVSRYCWFFIHRGGEISGKVVELKELHLKGSCRLVSI